MKKLILAVSVLALAACDKKEKRCVPISDEQRTDAYTESGLVAVNLIVGRGSDEH